MLTVNAMITVQRRLIRHFLTVLLPCVSAVAETPIDNSGYQATCAVKIAGWNGHLNISWPTGEGDMAGVVLDLSGEKPLFEKLMTSAVAGDARTIESGVD